MNITASQKMAHYSCATAFCIPLESGFVAAKFTVQYSAPFHLLFLRGAFSCLVLLLLTLGFRARFPSGRGMVRNLIVGLFLQSFFLGGCFYAIHRGMPSGIVALITGLQPVLTAILVSLMHRQSLHPRKWLGIAIGFAGVFWCSRQASIVLHWILWLLGRSCWGYLA